MRPNGATLQGVFRCPLGPAIWEEQEGRRGVVWDFVFGDLYGIDSGEVLATGMKLDKKLTQLLTDATLAEFLKEENEQLLYPYSSASKKTMVESWWPSSPQDRAHVEAMMKEGKRLWVRGASPMWADMLDYMLHVVTVHES